MISNCTSYGNNDGNMTLPETIVRYKNVTIQWCIIGGGRANSVDYSGSTLITGQSVTCTITWYTATVGGVGERCPLVHCNIHLSESPNADVRNKCYLENLAAITEPEVFWYRRAYGAAGNAVNNYDIQQLLQVHPMVLRPAPTQSHQFAYAAGNVSGNSGVNANGRNNMLSIHRFSICCSYAGCLHRSFNGAGKRRTSPRNTTDQIRKQCYFDRMFSNATTNQNPTVNAGADKQ